jgi:tetratricopeptide (TPR) repeat protein
MDHFVRALGNPKGYLTVTLIFKRAVFDKVGLFDESLPSHQETDLIIRAAKHFRGLGINKPLVRVNMRSGYDRTGGKLERRIAGREMLIKKHLEDLKQHPDDLAFHYFQLGLFYRQSGQFARAQRLFADAFQARPSWLYLRHYLSMIFSGRLYSYFRRK